MRCTWIWRRESGQVKTMAWWYMVRRFQVVLGFLLLVFLGAVGCITQSASECTSDSDCAADERCVSAGGFLLRGGVCAVEDFHPDVGVQDVELDDVGGDVVDDDVLQYDVDVDVELDAASDADADTEVERDTDGDMDTDVGHNQSQDCVALRPVWFATAQPASLSTLLTVEGCESGEPRGDIDFGDLIVREDGEELSVQPRQWTEKGHRTYTTVLLDLSGQGYEYRADVVAGVTDFVEHLMVERDQQNAWVGVDIFDGSETTTSWQLPLDDVDRIRDQIEEIVDGFEPADAGQTNLRGAIAHSVESLSDRLRTAQTFHGGGLVTTGNLVVFSANADSVGLYSTEEVRDLVTEAASFDTATPDGPLVRSRVLALDTDSQDISELEALFGADEVRSESEVEQLPSAFVEVADDIADQLSATHLLVHCSAKRSGEHILAIDAEGFETEPLSIAFSANGFEDGCDEEFLDGACEAFECGGLWCGGCQDESTTCRSDSLSGTCVDYCRATEECLDGSVVNPLGFEQTCELPEPFHSCADQCVDTSTHIEHCGLCDNQCPEGISCEDGVCDCDDGLIGCFGECIDPVDDDHHCGECDNRCDVRCDDGNCVGVDGVDGGWRHSCAVLENGHAKCWGDNEFGQLGNGESGGLEETPVAVTESTNIAQIYAGWKHSCALDVEGQIWCWGNNEYGQLGDGGLEDSTVPVAVDTSDIAGDIVDLALGEHHSCARTEQGRLYCWGRNRDGEIGLGIADDEEPLPQRVEEFHGDAVVDVDAGAGHTCAVVEEIGDQHLYCWGRNTNGQVGNGSSADTRAPEHVDALTDVVSVEVGSEHSCALAEDGLYCWGRTSQGRLGVDEDFSSLTQSTPLHIESLNTATQLVSGGGSTCALADDGDYWCWGRNTHGQLGADEDVLATPMTNEELQDFQSITMGNDHICGLYADGQISCRGRNNHQQLGDGSGQHQSSFVSVSWN